MASTYLQSLLHWAISAPCLVASMILACCGLSWAALELCTNHPWLLLLAASLVCTLAHCWYATRRQGLLGLLPSWVILMLQRPIFEMVRTSAVVAVLFGGNVVRLLLLALADLDREQQKQVLEELSDDYRRNCFRRPSIELLPSWLQLLLLGTNESSDWEQDNDNSELSNTEESMLQVAPPSRKDSSASTTSQTHIGELLENLRTMESAARRVEIPMLQKVLNEKISDIALVALRHGGRNHVEKMAKPLLRQCTNSVKAVGATVKAVQEVQQGTRVHVGHTVSAASSAANDVWFRVRSLSWAAISLPWRLTYKSMGLYLQGTQMLARVAYETASDMGFLSGSCSRRKNSSSSLKDSSSDIVGGAGRTCEGSVEELSQTPLDSAIRQRLSTGSQLPPSESGEL